MPGKLALAVELVLLLGFVLFIKISVQGINRQRGLLRQRGFYFALIFFAAGLIMTLGRFQEIKSHFFLKNLSVSSVAAIRVGEQDISRQEDLAVVIPALNDVDWFLVNHGGWASEVPMTITLKNGKAQTFSIGRYRRQEGAVV